MDKEGFRVFLDLTLTLKHVLPEDLTSGSFCVGTLAAIHTCALAFFQGTCWRGLHGRASLPYSLHPGSPYRMMQDLVQGLLTNSKSFAGV